MYVNLASWLAAAWDVRYSSLLSLYSLIVVQYSSFRLRKARKKQTLYFYDCSCQGHLSIYCVKFYHHFLSFCSIVPGDAEYNVAVEPDSVVRQVLDTFQGLRARGNLLRYLLQSLANKINLIWDSSLYSNLAGIFFFNFQWGILSNTVTIYKTIFFLCYD